MRRMLAVIVVAIAACGDCEDAGSVNNLSANDMGTSGDLSSADNQSPSNGESNEVEGSPEYAGIPGECSSDEECRGIYGGSRWPYADPPNLNCVTEVESGLGYCTECTTAVDCDQGYHCHDERFCWPNEEDHSGCVSNEQCKAEAEANPSIYKNWSPRHPISCIPYRETDPGCIDCENSTTASARCRQCVSDSDCTPGGRCLNNERCTEPCETDADCPDFWRCLPDLLLCEAI